MFPICLSNQLKFRDGAYCVLCISTTPENFNGKSLMSSISMENTHGSAIKFYNRSHVIVWTHTHHVDLSSSFFVNRYILLTDRQSNHHFILIFECVIDMKARVRETHLMDRTTARTIYFHKSKPNHFSQLVQKVK